MVRKVGVALITQTFTSDSIGQKIPTNTTKTVIGDRRNVSGTEINEAGQRGIQASLVVDIWAHEYAGEKIVAVEGIVYSVYRTYLNEKTGKIELYLERRVG